MAVLVAGCSGPTTDSGQGESTPLGEEAQARATVEEYWLNVADGNYGEAKSMVVGEELFDDAVYGSGECDTSSYEAFGDSGEKLDVEAVEFDKVIKAAEGNEQIVGVGANTGFLVSYSLIGTLQKSGASGPYEKNLEEVSMASLVVKKDGSWKLVPEF